MNKIRVLFVCIHNSARSRMAEAFLNKLGDGRFEAESAGIEPGKLNPVVVKAMREVEYDISKNPTNSVFEFFKEGRVYSYVITVCDESSSERCPVFSGALHKLHWSFPDPSSFSGSEEEKLVKTRKVRDDIKVKVGEFIKSVGV